MSCLLPLLCGVACCVLVCEFVFVVVCSPFLFLFCLFSFAALAVVWCSLLVDDWCSLSVVVCGCCLLSLCVAVVCFCSLIWR